MKPLFIFVITLIAFGAACKNYNKPSESSINGKKVENQIILGTFASDTQLILYSASITLPKGWRRANDDTLQKVADATTKYRFHNKNGKLIYLQYGFTFGKPAEPNVIPAHDRQGYIKHNLDTTDIIFSDNPKVAEHRKKSEYSFTFDKVASFEAIFFRPKQTGKGYTGIYIDSIGQRAGSIVNLVLFGKGLDSIENVEMQKVIQSLVLKRFE